MTARQLTMGLVGVVGLLIFASGCMARQRSWDGSVRQAQDGSVCFSIEKESMFGLDVVRVAAIVVSELDEQERVRRTTWTADFTRAEPSVELSPQTCISYGSRDSNRIVGPIIPIESGRRYTVFVNADSKDGSEWESRGYRAYFCVVQDAKQRRLVREVQWDKSLGRRRWDACASSHADGHQS